MNSGSTVDTPDSEVSVTVTRNMYPCTQATYSGSEEETVCKD